MEEWTRHPEDGQVTFVRPDSGRVRVQTVNLSESRTVQSDRETADIKSILAKYEATGIVQHLAKVDLQFRDVTEFTDLADAMRQAKEAEKHFMKLPSKLREVFNHDVAEWLDAAHDPEKIEALRPQLEKLGVLDPLPAPEAPAVVSPTPAPEAD